MENRKKIRVRCPKCREYRMVNAQALKLPAFTGLCIHCWGRINGKRVRTEAQRLKLAQSLVKHYVINGIDKPTKDLKGCRSIHKSFLPWYGKPTHCENDPTHTAKNNRFHRATLTGIYTKNIEDYASLCPSCHKLYDFNKVKVHGLFKSERMVLNGIS